MSVSRVALFGVLGVVLIVFAVTRRDLLFGEPAKSAGPVGAAVGDERPDAGARPEPTAGELFTEARDALDRMQNGEATRLLRRVLRLDPSHAEALGLQAYIHHTQGRDEQAAADANRALELDPSVSTAYTALGWVAFADSRFREAGPHFRKAIELDESDWLPRLALGRLLHSTGSYEAAAEMLESAVTLAPQHDRPARVLAITLGTRLGQFDRAINLMDGVIDRAPHRSANYLMRGRVFMSAGDYDRAAADYERAIELAPRSGDAIQARTYLAQMANNRGEHAAALEQLNAVLDRRPNHSWALQIRGDTYRNLREHEKAIADYKQYLEANPAAGSVATKVGFAYLDLGQADLADMWFNRGVLSVRFDWFTWYGRGWGHMKSHRYPQAISDLEQARQIDPRERSIYDPLIWCLLAVEDYESAAVVASEAAKRWPDDSRTHFYRAQALALLGASQRAIDDFRKAAEAGSDPYLWHKLAAYALVLDEPALGRQWAERGMNDPRLNRPQRGRCLVHAATAVYLSDGPEAAAALLDEHADLVRGSSFWPAAAEFLRHRVGLADLVTHAGGPDEWAAAHLLAGLLQEAAGDVDAARQLYRQVSRPGDEPVPYEYVARVGVGALMGVR